MGAESTIRGTADSTPHRSDLVSPPPPIALRQTYAHNDFEWYSPEAAIRPLHEVHQTLIDVMLQMVEVTMLCHHHLADVHVHRYCVLRRTHVEPNEWLALYNPTNITLGGEKRLVREQRRVFQPHETRSIRQTHASVQSHGGLLHVTLQGHDAYNVQLMMEEFSILSGNWAANDRLL